MNEVYIIMQYENSNYPENDNNHVRAVYSDPLTANAECDRLEDIEGNAFISFEVIHQEVR